MHNGTEGKLDARPSDAVALAVRVDADIFVAPEVLDEAGIPTEEEVTMTREEPVEEEEPLPKSPLARLQKQLEDAIAEENYELAAQIRDKIQRLESESN